MGWYKPLILKQLAQQPDRQLHVAQVDGFWELQIYTHGGKFIDSVVLNGGERNDLIRALME